MRVEWTKEANRQKEQVAEYVPNPSVSTKRKTSFPFAFPSFFRNFVRILSFSLNKGSLGN